MFTFPGFNLAPHILLLLLLLGYSTGSISQDVESRGTGEADLYQNWIDSGFGDSNVKMYSDHIMAKRKVATVDGW